MQALEIWSKGLMRFACVARSVFSRPVQALTVMDGRLVAAFGNNMQMMELRGSSLRMISFFHAQMLITSVATIKNFILLGDVHKGLTFVYADKKANYTALTQLSKVLGVCQLSQ